MFGLFTNKKKKKDKIDRLLIDKMREYSSETEKSCRNFIGYMIEDYPNENIEPSSLGLYKTRLVTNLMVACGAQISKAKIGFGNGDEFMQGVQIATAIAYEPFSDKKNPNYLNKNKISNETEQFVKKITNSVIPFYDEIEKGKINRNSEYFRIISLHIIYGISDCISNIDKMEEIIQLESLFFENMTNQNLKIMSNFSRI